MMVRIVKNTLALALFGLLSMSLFLPPVGAQVRGNFLYRLSNFTGTIPYSWPRICVDNERLETYVLYQNIIRVFNETGMEVYSFGDELELGAIVDLSVEQDGNILVLSHKWTESGDRVDYTITRCDYRGEPISRIEVKNIPSNFSKFLPNRMVYRGGELYLASLASMMVAVTDAEGVFKRGYDILPLLELEEKEKADAMMVGFTVDREGNIFFTVPPIFKAYKLSPDLKIAYFGKPGAAPGRFNIISGITTDSRGNILVVDKLKCAVMVFDKNYNFLTQFATRGYKPGELIAPDDIAIDSQDRIYVTQSATRGVSVYKLTYS